MTLCLHPDDSYLSYSFGSLKLVSHNDNPSRRPFFALPLISLPFHFPSQISHSLPISITHRTPSPPRSPSPNLSDHSSVNSIIKASREHNFPLKEEQMTADAAIVFEKAFNERFHTNRSNASFSPPVSLLRKVAHWIVSSDFGVRPASD